MQHLLSRVLVVQVATTLLAAGCGAPAGAQPVSTAPPVAEPASVPSASPTPQTSTPEAGAAPTTASLVLPAQGGSGRFQGLEVSVVDVVEKRLMDGSGMMRVGLRLRAAGKEEAVELTSDQPKLEWNGYELEYRGGWRQEVQLGIRRLSP